MGERKGNVSRRKKKDVKDKQGPIHYRLDWGLQTSSWR